MPKCIDCGEEYEIKPEGDIMLSICYECRKKPKPPEAYIRKSGLLIPNPEYDKWQKETQEATK